MVVFNSVLFFGGWDARLYIKEGVYADRINSASGVFAGIAMFGSVFFSFLVEA